MPKPGKSGQEGKGEKHGGPKGKDPAVAKSPAASAVAKMPGSPEFPKPPNPKDGKEPTISSNYYIPTKADETKADDSPDVVMGDGTFTHQHPIPPKGDSKQADQLARALLAVCRQTGAEVPEEVQHLVAPAAIHKAARSLAKAQNQGRKHLAEPKRHMVRVPPSNGGKVSDQAKRVRSKQFCLGRVSAASPGRGKGCTAADCHVVCQQAQAGHRSQQKVCGKWPR